MRAIFLAAAASLALGLGACQSVTPYQPRVAGARVGGYSEERIDAGHWKVRFSGNRATSRETVERYLVYRAAEITLAQGQEWFVMNEAATEQRTRYRLARSSIDSHPDSGADTVGPPGWRYDSGGEARRPDQSRERYDVLETNRYVATADVTIGSGQRPQTPFARDARAVIAELGPKVSRPPG